MTLKQYIGSTGESLAVAFLKDKGYSIQATNFRFRRAEIDIIASNDNYVVFVEVKTRKNADYGYPESFLSEAQQERIHWASEAYLDKNAWQGKIRFDIISILWDEKSHQIEHFEDAF